MKINITATLRCVNLSIRFPSSQDSIFGAPHYMTGEFEIHPMNKNTPSPTRAHVNIDLTGEEMRTIRDVFTAAAARVLTRGE